MSALGSPPAAIAPPIGDEIFACDFENPPTGANPAGSVADRDYDGWPDGWTREHSLKLPEFVRVSIVGEGQTIAAHAAQPAAAEVNRVVRIELDGGGAAIKSPASAISPQFSLLLTARVRAMGLKHDRAWVSLSLLNASGQELQTIASRQVEATGAWQTVEIGPFTPASDQAARAVITLHLGPAGDDQDLTGSAEFDDMRLVRLPRMTLMAGSLTGIHTDPNSPEFTCHVSGIRIADPEVQFDLLDQDGQVLATHTSPLTAIDFASGAAVLVADHGASGVFGADGLSGKATWKPAVPGFGFYHVAASLVARGKQEKVLSSRRSFAVLRPFPPPQHSEFGWTLPAEEEPFGYGPLATLLGQAGLGWAKIPVWYDARDAARGERVSWLAEQVSIHGIELVGVLDQPPEELRQVFREPGRLPVASVFTIEPELWEPVVNPVMTRLSLRIRWWQLGDDQDTSFVGLPQVEAKIAEIKQRLQQSGQEVRLGVGWRWLYSVPPTPQGKLPWTFLSYYGEPQLTAEEMSAYVPTPGQTAPVSRASSLSPGALKSLTAPQKWLVLAPLDRDEYVAAARVQDLVRRMLAARIHGASAAFVPQPFDDRQGLMNADGTPGELFVPWRTTATLIGGADYLGPIQLPGGSTCHAFGRDGQAILAIWNDHVTTERLPVGDAVEQIDVWGRNVPPAAEPAAGAPERDVPVGPLPTFLTGQSAEIAKWQAGVAFDNPRVPSVYNVEQLLGLSVRNPFNQAVGGEVKLHAPESWGAQARSVRFKAAAGEIVKLALPVMLSAEADSGPQQVRLDFELTAERSYKFSVYRTLQLGLEDVRIELSTKLREDGALLVEQQLVNLSSKPVSFQCLLFPPGRRREIRQIIGAAEGPSTTTYVLPRGAELIGQKLTLRAEEIGGARVLKQAVTAEP